MQDLAWASCNAAGRTKGRGPHFRLRVPAVRPFFRKIEFGKNHLAKPKLHSSKNSKPTGLKLPAEHQFTMQRLSQVALRRLLSPPSAAAAARWVTAEAGSGGGIPIFRFGSSAGVRSRFLMGFWLLPRHALLSFLIRVFWACRLRRLVGVADQGSACAVGSAPTTREVWTLPVGSVSLPQICVVLLFMGCVDEMQYS
jgi:hypothetical protein